MIQFTVAALLFCATVSTVLSADCNKTITVNGTTVNVQSPGYPNPYPDNQTCKYVINNIKNAKLYMHVNNLSLRPNDTVTIYNGTDTKQIIAQYDANHGVPSNQFKVLYSMDAVITIVLVATKSSHLQTVAGSGFNITVVPNSCTVDVNGLSTGTFSTPQYLPANSNISCTYTITILDKTSYLGLSFDNVDIINGSVQVNGATYSDGTTQMSDEIINSNQITVKVVLLATHKQNGFQAAYTTLNSGCSNVMTFADDNMMLLKSPGYPSDYSNNLLCRWIINSLPDSTMLFGFEDFMMADQYDNVIINDGNSRSSRPIEVLNKGSNPSPIPLATTGNSMWIQFMTDEAQTSEGFRMVVREVAYGGTYLNSGSFSVVNKSSSVPVSNTTQDDIYIQLVAEKGYKLQVNFTAILLPASSIDCYDGLTANDPHIAHLRTDKPFYPVFTEGHFMLIVVHGFLRNGTYHSNQSVHGTFVSITPENLQKYSLDGSSTYGITTSDVTKGNATWLVHKPVEGPMSLQFSELTVLPGYSVIVYEGLSDQSAVLASFSETPQQTPVFYMNSDLRITYNQLPKAPIANNSDTVLMASSIMAPNCSMNLTASSGVITSPLYPDMYPVNAKCMVTINVPANKLVHIVFSAFKLVSDHQLSITTMTGNKSTPISIFGNQETPGDIITSGKQIMVDFSSQSKNKMNLQVASGFSLMYDIMECGANITNKMSGRIETPKYPALVNGTTTCIWIITLPKPANKGSVNILNFTYDVKSYKEKDGNMLEIKDGGMNSSDGLDVKLKNGESEKALSRYNQLWIKYTFNSTGAKDTGFAFQLTFTSFECNKSQQCGNGICLHPDWQCNGVDECGDMTDEKNCTTKVHSGIKPWTIAVTVLITFFLAVFITLAVPVIMRKIRNRRYNEMTEVYSPIET